MSETPALSIYESTFAKNDKTDAILVVDGKKLHVNKALLSYHSDYFDKLFNSDFKEKSMPEIELKDVKIEHFSGLLSLITLKPMLTELKIFDELERLLELSDRFLLTSVKDVLEILLLFSNISNFEKIRIADKFHLDDALEKVLSVCTDCSNFIEFKNSSRFEGFSDSTKLKILDRLMTLISLK